MVIKSRGHLPPVNISHDDALDFLYRINMAIEADGAMDDFFDECLGPDDAKTFEAWLKQEKARRKEATFEIARKAAKKLSKVEFEALRENINDCDILDD